MAYRWVNTDYTGGHNLTVEKDSVKLHHKIVVDHKCVTGRGGCEDFKSPIGKRSVTGRGTMMKDFNITIRDIDLILEWYNSYQQEGGSTARDRDLHKKLNDMWNKLEDYEGSWSLDCELRYDY